MALSGSSARSPSAAHDWRVQRRSAALASSILGISVSALACYDVWGELQVDDSNGSEIEETNLDPAPWFGLSVQLAF